eukprot:scaffold31709_cov41-Cyclotella_meneghiniana.AAC.10
MQPPQTPPYDPEGSATENALITIQWQKNKELWDQMQNANKALINSAKGALNEESRDALTNLFVGTADRNFFLFFDEFYTKWGKATPVDIKRNNKNMYKSWDPTVQDISALLRRIRTAYLLSAFINHEKSEKDMVTAGENLLLETHQFSREYTEWRKIAEAKRTWRKFEEFWTDAFNLWLETSRTASSMGFGGNMEEIAEEEKALIDSINQFSAANVHNSQTFEALSQANAQMANNMASQIQQLTKQMESLAMAQCPAITTASISNKLCTSSKASINTKVTADEEDAVEDAVEDTPAIKEAEELDKVSTISKEDIKGNKKILHQAPANGGFYDGQNPAPNPVKYHKTWWYCWSHGYDVDHDSAHCPLSQPQSRPRQLRDERQSMQRMHDSKAQNSDVTGRGSE